MVIQNVSTEIECLEGLDLKGCLSKEGQSKLRELKEIKSKDSPYNSYHITVFKYPDEYDVKAKSRTEALEKINKLINYSIFKTEIKET